MVTMNDIAAQTGVSRATVSFVLAGRHEELRIGEETRQRVLKAASELGYRRNTLADAVRAKHNKMLGFLVNHPEHDAVAHILAGALDEAEQEGYTIKILRLHDNQLDHQTIDRCLGLRLAGVTVLYLGREMLDYLHGEMAKHDVPIAVADSNSSLPYGVRVDTDTQQAMNLAVKHLVGLGHRRIAFFTTSYSPRFGAGQPSVNFAAMREAAFRQAMASQGLEVPQGTVVDSHFVIENVRLVLEKLLRHPAGAPTAAIGVTDGEAMHVVHAALRLGLDVPREFSVVGFGGLNIGQYCAVPLTAIAQPFYELGRVSTRRLLERVAPAKPDDSPLEELLPAQLLERSSTAVAPPNPRANPTLKDV